MDIMIKKRFLQAEVAGCLLCFLFYVKNVFGTEDEKKILKA